MIYGFLYGPLILIIQVFDLDIITSQTRTCKWKLQYIIQVNMLIGKHFCFKK